jgi:DinB superfamily
MKTATKKTAKKTTDQSLREHVTHLLDGGGAHAKFDDVIKGLPPNLRGVRPEKFPHSPWMLLEHLRLAQWDILEFSRNGKHVSPKWPEGYWPPTEAKTEAPPSDAAWNKSIRQFRRDLKAMQKLVSNPRTDLFALIPWGDGQTILREALLLADHNAYHLGQLVDLRRLLAAWG